VNAKIQLVLWISHPALELLLAGAMVWRQLHRKFPVFFAYVLFQLVNFAVLFPIHQYGGYELYFYTYWISSTISLAIGFKVIHEIFLDVFRPYHTLQDLGTVLFKWAALVMIFVALVVAVASPGGQSPIALAVMTMQRCVRVTQCGLILFLLFFSRYLAVSWKQPSFGIASGFGLFAAVELGANAFFAGGQISEQTVGFLATLSYSCAILGWIGYALTKPLARKVSGAPLVSQRWEQSLTDLQHPAAADSLIPMFEGMVDRAFSKTSGEQDAQTFSGETFVRETSASQSFTGTLPLPRLHSLR
jgi:hypothetical protein